MLVALDRLHPHPANPNVMPDEMLEKLARNIEKNGVYPPAIARPHPELPGEFQLIDGEQRSRVARRLGQDDLLCFIVDCDDATALTLLATINRLHGEDVPVRRATLLSELSEMLPAELLASLLPESAEAIEQSLALLEFDANALLAELAADVERHRNAGPALLSFALPPEDVPDVETTVASVAATLSGSNRRGRALAIICRQFLRGMR